MRDLAAAHPGPTWTARFDHAPAVPPFDALGPTHGADNACLWTHPPRFVERPLLGRPGAAMSAADRAVTEELHDAFARSWDQRRARRCAAIRTGASAAPYPRSSPVRCTASRNTRPPRTSVTTCR